ncbi:PhoD-like phosphatase-domain-containing protein [Phyllosticta paracitricarpa]|uniref:PhoD-like phosphatase-domain-containing protein n=1 Tax=Phyllosticta paracitricarpa TaxID=2016321 RepID=A0ABR1N7S0_9PEZI
MKLSAVILAVGVGCSSASYADNLVFGSPSRHHPFLGLPIYKIVKRHDPSVRFVAAEHLNWTHSVASGDPYPNSVILWTRCSPMYDNAKSKVTAPGFTKLYDHHQQETISVSTAPICVEYRVSTDENIENVVSSGTAYTSSDVDYTVKVEACGLEPFTRYYYQFRVCGTDHTSPIGRTKTAPATNDEVPDIALAVYSCSNYPFGYFTAFGNVARKDSVDYVLHLGDFLYEYAEGVYGYGWKIGRKAEPDKEIRTLYDYRKRHSQYRSDLDAIENFAKFPWIPVWDDHEVGDNTYRDGMADQNNTRASFLMNDIPTGFGGAGIAFDQRKMNAVRAYFEWMPIRQVEMDDNLRIWRTFSIGSLMDIFMLDTRQYDRSITDLYWNTDYIHEISNDVGRTMMGSRQENWFYRKLSASHARGAAWRLIGSQTIFSRINESVTQSPENPMDYDAWDGYQANRNRTFAHLYEHGINNNIVMAGDSHASWASDLIWLDEHDYDQKTGAGAIGVEFSGTAVSSPPPIGQNTTMREAKNISELLIRDNRELQWQDSYYRGYYELHVSYDAVRARFFGMPTLVHRTALEVSLANFTVLRDANALQRPVAGGIVESGTLKNGKTIQTNLTNNTLTGHYSIHNLATFGYDQTVDEEFLL